MRSILPVVLLILCTWIGCARSPTAARMAAESISSVGAGGTNKVTIVAIPRYYFSGFPRLQWGEIYGDTNAVDNLRTDAVLLEIVSPKEYEGKMYGMHDDDWAAHRYLQLGKRYELRVNAEEIGRFGFRDCTASPFRELTVDK